MRPLYEIAGEYLQDIQKLSDLELDEQTIADTVESMQGELTDKLRAVIAYAYWLQSEADMQSEAAKRMHDRAESTKKKAKSLLDYALSVMQATSVPSISTAEWSAKIAKNPTSVRIIDASLIPLAYMRTPAPPDPQPDKTAIKTAISSGAQIPGAELTTTYRLQIR